MRPHPSTRRALAPRLLLACLLAASPLARASEAAPQISEINVLLPPQCEIELSVTGGSGCYEWTSDREDLARVVHTDCDGGTSSAVVRTGEAATGLKRAFIRAVRPSDKLPDESVDPSADDPTELVCEVNVAEVSSLEIFTVTRRMFAQERQWLQVAALDADGNFFSLPGMRTMRFDWSFSPAGALELSRKPPHQQLEPELLRLSEAEMKRYYKIPVRAAPLPTVAYVRARLVHPEREVVREEPIQIINTSLTIEPHSLVMAPGMGHQYGLRFCPESAECSGSEPPPPASTHWWLKTSSFVHTSPVAAVNASGYVDALQVGTANVGAKVSMLHAEVELAVALPHALVLTLARECADDVEEGCAGWAEEGECACSPERMKKQCGTSCCTDAARTTIVEGEERLVKLSLMAEDEEVPMLLPSAEDAPAHLLPRLYLPKESTSVLSLERTSPLRCGRSCSLDCPLEGVCEAPADGRVTRPTCLCALLTARRVGKESVHASLGASPAATHPSVAWGALAAALPIRVVSPLSLPPHPVRHPHLCTVGAELPAVPVVPLPYPSGGSGAWRWRMASSLADGVSVGPHEVHIRQPCRLRLAALDVEASSATACLEVETVAISALEILAHEDEEVLVGSDVAIAIGFRGAADEQLLRFDSCDAAMLDWQLSSLSTPPDATLAFVGTATPSLSNLTAASTTCYAECPSDPAISCALLHLRAAHTGSSTLSVTLANRCAAADAPLHAAVRLHAIARLAPRPVRLCASPADAPVPHAVHLRARDLTAPLRRAALGDASALALETQLPDALSVELVGHAEEHEAIWLRLACSRPHSQLARLAAPLRTHAAAPAAASTLELEVLCAPPPSVRDGAARRVLAIGEAAHLHVSGGWAGAELLANASFDPSGQRAAAPPLLTTTPLAQEEGDAGFAGWDLSLLPRRSGLLTLRLALDAPDETPSCATAPPVELVAAFSGFVVTCPSRTMLPGETMRCYALPSAAGIALAPTTDLLDVVSFNWSIASDAVAARPLLAASTPTRRESFVVLVTARAVGHARLSVRAVSAGVASDVSFAIAVVEPLGRYIHPALAAEPPMLLAANTTLCLLQEGGGAGERAARGAPCMEWRTPPSGTKWTFCDGSTESSSGASINAQGALFSAAAASHLCALATLPSTAFEGDALDRHSMPDPPQTQPLMFEVTRVAAIRLLVTAEGGEGGAHFNGVLSAGTATRVCAIPVDIWGRPFLAAGLAADWLQLQVSPPSAVAVAITNSSTDCFVLEPQAEWEAVAGQRAALLEVGMRLPEPLEPSVYAFAPLIVGEGATAFSSPSSEGYRRDLVVAFTLLLALAVSIPLCHRKPRVATLDPRAYPEIGKRH
ncbi:hypothetical protein AB1Y20_000466 [Prymnesium parvum]|uniref:BIG2 domain-containing protein n=1 Tax=Prymnesium parvum TaxID=97485 RepID=A0AB34K5W1_PRYPA